MKIGKIIFRRCPNSDLCVFNVNTNLSDYGQVFFSRPITDEAEDSLKRIGDLGEILVRDILLVEGVIGLRLFTYEIHVEKAVAFEWEEIHDSVISTLKWALEKKGFVKDQIVVSEQNQRPLPSREDQLSL